MTDELKETIENLYKTFAIYPLKSTIGCPCCVSDSDKEKIHYKQLRNLDGDDLSRYAFKAMTTWGDTDDFKHYLPRIFELLVTTNFPVATFVILGKLDYGKWTTWTKNEKNSIIKFLLAFWTDHVKNSYFDKDTFIVLNKVIGNSQQLLDCWTIDFNDNSFMNFIDLIYNYYADLTSNKNHFKEINDKEIEIFVQLIKTNSEFIEKGFFHYADKDKEFAEKISIAQAIFERNYLEPQNWFLIKTDFNLAF